MYEMNVILVKVYGQMCKQFHFHDWFIYLQTNKHFSSYGFEHQM